MKFYHYTILLFFVIGCGSDKSVTVTADMGSRQIGSSMMDMELADATTVLPDEDAGMPPEQCREGERMPCDEACGVRICTDGAFSDDCETAAELCNGIDDDCDENVDEDYEANGLGFSCQIEQENGCLGLGVYICSDSATSVTCDTEPKEPETEVCDGSDNDCDGTIDEDFPDQVCCQETYQCPIGNLCIDGSCTKDDGTLNPGGPSGTNECSRSSDCPIGQYCDNGSCVSSGGVCLSDSDCENGFRCDDYLCVPNLGGGACTYDFECETGEVCEDGRCTPESGLCFIDADCADGYVCENFECIEGNRGVGGDFCGAVQPFGTGTSATGDTTLRSDSVRPSCARANSESPDLIFRWRPAITETYTLNTNGSDFDTVLAITNGCSASGTELACDDDDGESTRSELTFDATAGETYYVIVSGWSSAASGQAVLNIVGETPTEPDCSETSDCSSGLICQDGQCVPPVGGGACETPLIIETGTEARGDTNGALDGLRPSCGYSGSESPDRIYQWQPNESGIYTLTTEGSDFDTVMAVYSACTDVSAQIVCNDDGGGAKTSKIEDFTATAGNTYYIVVTGYNTDDTGAYRLKVNQESTTSPECTVSSDCDSGEQCTNNECIAETMLETSICDYPIWLRESLIEGTYPQTMTLTLNEDRLENCDGSTGADGIINWYPVFGGTFTIRAEASFAVTLAVYENCNDLDGSLITCEDRWDFNDYEEITRAFEASGNSYLIHVSSESVSDQGSVEIVFTCTDGDCAN